MRLILTPEAKDDVWAAASHYERERKGLGVELREEIEVFVSLITNRPQMFARVHPRVRRAPLRRFPYSVFYTMREGTVHVIAVLHHARDPELWKQRHRPRRA